MHCLFIFLSFYDNFETSHGLIEQVKKSWWLEKTLNPFQQRIYANNIWQCIIDIYLSSSQWANAGSNCFSETVSLHGFLRKAEAIDCSQRSGCDVGLPLLALFAFLMCVVPILGV